jgi:SecD/SecF fusion protein
VPVLIALAHDILITGGVYALTQREVTTSTVAALLTILGYSLYDTIIVFDRVRENAPRMPRATFSQIVNRSMSEVLSRSLATTLCTLLPVLALLFFGGQTLKDFAFALLVGIASGAYSSIFIASPVLTEWKEREPLYRRRRQLVAEDHGGVVPAYASMGPEEEEVADGTRKRTGRRVIAERPGRPSRTSREPAPQRMAGPLAPEIEAPEAAAHVIDRDEIDPDADAELAEDSAEVTNGSPADANGAPRDGNGASGDSDADAAAAARRAERRRQQRAKRKHGRP